MTTKKTYHILPHPKGGWSVKSSSSDKVLRKFPTREKAISNAKKVAKSQKSVIYVHGKDGFVRDSINYGAGTLKSGDHRPIGEAKGKIKIAEDFDEEYVSIG